MLLNVPAAFAAVIGDPPNFGPDGFASFAKVGAFEFPPRSTFAAFIDSQTERLRLRANGRLICHAQAFCTAVETNGNSNGGISYTVTLDDNTNLVADAVILAIGQTSATPAYSPRNISSSNARYIAYPFAPAALEAVPAGAKVGVIGSGLSAVDVAKHLLLREKNPVASVALISRRGLLPMAANVNGYDGEPYSLKFLSRETVDQYVSAKGGHSSAGLLEGLAEIVLKEMKAAQPDVNWLEMMESVVTPSSSSFTRASTSTSTSTGTRTNSVCTSCGAGVELLRRAVRRMAEGKEERWLFAGHSVQAEGLWTHMWQQLNDDEKAQFLQDFGTLNQVGGWVGWVSGWFHTTCTYRLMLCSSTYFNRGWKYLCTLPSCTRAPGVQQSDAAREL
jgi:hypothetical protein